MDGEGNTKLHALAEAGAGYEVVLAVARASAQLGIDINALNKGGDTALVRCMCAAAFLCKPATCLGAS